MIVLLSPIRLPTSFAPVALSAGRRGNGWRYSFGCKLLQATLRAPLKTLLPIVHLPFGGIAPSGLRLFFSTAASQQRKRYTNGGFIDMASTLFCHALRQQAFVVVGGRAVGGEKMQRYGGRSKTP
ncbi:MAG: hypothetical protein H9535_18560 [Ignavibacteria bacterium]|nr:hypothetical protein [Ignavibacteria bacterium]